MTNYYRIFSLPLASVPAVIHDFASGMNPVKTSGYTPDVSERLYKYVSPCYQLLVSDPGRA